jgi:hypothetical protein
MQDTAHYLTRNYPDHDRDDFTGNGGLKAMPRALDV